MTPTAGPPSSVSVLVPSFRRPDFLVRCLTALVAQERSPDQVIVVAHTDDEETSRAAERFASSLPLELMTVPDRRIVPMMRAGVAAATCDVVAATDDDAEPRPDWLARLLRGYAADVGGVGGRDLIDADTAGETAKVGVVRWFGRRIGNHHRGTGPARDVDVLKGVNMSMRRELWRLDPDLRGAGTQEHWELDVCLRARSEGWRLVYDPAILVEHRRAPRVDEDARDELRAAALTDAVHNELLAILRWSPAPRRLTAAVYAFLVGHRRAPGALVLIERLVRERHRVAAIRRAAAGARGRALAVRSWRARRRAR
jgi:cellulose synthase/poly-beta-1,6-N-acetylglucosamine synthase-like glycosyltransferase